MSEYTTRLGGLVLLFAVSALCCWICYYAGWEAGRASELEQHAKWERNDKHDMDLCIPGTLHSYSPGSWTCQY